MSVTVINMRATGTCAPFDRSLSNTTSLAGRQGTSSLFLLKQQENRLRR
jgi:hypothetical protein